MRGTAALFIYSGCPSNLLLTMMPSSSINTFVPNELPLITIVTVVFNGEKYIEKTIKSIINQTYLNIEYIIIDGGSTDKTLSIISRYEMEIDYWISETDNGIYDAMNKAIKLATGKWIIFMNAGDIFFGVDTLNLVFGSEAENTDYDIIYGNVHIRYPDFSRIEKPGNLNQLWSGMKFCHQSVFVRTQLHKAKPFNSANRIAADLEFFYSAYKSGTRFNYVDIIIASVLTGGLSESNRIKTILASRDAVSKSGGGLVLIIIYYIFCINSMMRSWIKIIIPKKLSRLIIKMKR